MEDTFVKRLAKKNVAVWTARAETAREAGNSLLLKKALKWKARYEQELIALENLEAEPTARHELAPASADCQSEPEDSCLCPLLNYIPGFMDDDLDATSLNPDLVRRCVDSLDLTLADVEAMETSFDGLPICKRCRTQQGKMRWLLLAFRKAVAQNDV